MKVRLSTAVGDGEDLAINHGECFGPILRVVAIKSDSRKVLKPRYRHSVDHGLIRG